MAHDEIPKGELFSRAYLMRGDPLRDSERFRRRLEAYAESYLGFIASQGSQAKPFSELLAHQIHMQLGVDVPVGYDSYNFASFFRTAATRDLLDTVTLIWRLLMTVREQRRAEPFLAFVAAALAEENLGYRVDERGGIHVLVDAEFERNRTAT